MFYPCGSILAILFKVVKTLFDFFFEAAVSLHHVELEDFLLAGLFLIDFRSVLSLSLLSHYAKNELSFRVFGDNLYFSH